MRHWRDLGVLAACLGAVFGCGNTSRESEEQFADVLTAAVALVEKHSPLSAQDPAVLSFKEQHPAVVELLIVVDKRNRISLIPSGAVKEVIDERRSPITGTLHFENQPPIEFVEFHRACTWGQSKATVLVRVRKPSRQ